MSERVAGHVDAFNEAVPSGRWDDFSTRFTPGARMEFVGVPAGPFEGRAAIAAAYRDHPPDDTMIVVSMLTDGDTDVVRFRWDAGGSGTMRLTWTDTDDVAALVVAFD